MRKKIRCKICGRHFQPLAENRYEIAEDNLISVIAGECKTMKCFDCPYCGCQSIANIRRGRVSNDDSTT